MDSTCNYMHIKFTDLVVKCICVRNVSRMLELAGGIIGKNLFGGIHVHVGLNPQKILHLLYGI